MINVKSTSTFLISLFLSCSLVVQMVIYLAHVLFNWDLGLDLFQYCIKFIKESTNQRISLDIILFFLIGYTVLKMLIDVINQSVKTNRLKKKLRTVENQSLTDSINDMFGRKKKDITVVENSTPLAFTFGLFHPRIVLTTAIIEILEQRELEAVILHEECHQKHFDPLKYFLFSIVSSTMWYLPVIKGLFKNYKILRELIADRYATKIMDSRIYLCSALLKMLKTDVKKEDPAIFVSFANSAINYRIQQLIEPKVAILLPINPKASIVSVLVILLLNSLFLGGCS